MALQIAAAHILGRQRLIVGARVQINPLLDDHQPLADCGWCDAKANPQPRGKGFRQRADIDRMLRRQLFDRRHGHAVVAQIAVGIVFDQQDIVILDNARHLLAASKGQGATGWVLKRWRQINKLDRLRAYHCFQRFWDQAIVIRGQFHITWFIGRKGLQRADIGGRFDGHEITLPNQNFAQRIQHTLRATGN